jgi:hypothetical protein
MKTKASFLVVAFLLAGAFLAMAQSNPGSTNATDVEMQLAWPDGQVYYSGIHNVDTTTLYDYYYVNGQWYWNWFDNFNWQETTGGGGYQGLTGAYTNQYNFPASRWPELPATGEIPDWDTSANYGSIDFTSSFQNFSDQDNYQLNDHAEVSLITGGEPGSTGTELYAISGTAVTTTYTDQTLPSGIPSGIASGQVQIGNLGTLAPSGTVGGWIPSGTLYAVLPMHTEVLVTPNVAASGSIQARVNVQPCPLISQCFATTPANRARTTLGVGEQVALYFGSTLPTNAQWSTTGGGLSLTSGMTNLFTAPSNAPNGTFVKVTAAVFGKPVSITFNVVEPSGHGFAQISGTNHFSVGEIGAGMTNQLWLFPTNVSFYRVFTWELPAGIANVTGYFTNNSGQIPSPNIGSAQLNEVNNLTDIVASGLFDFSSYSLPLFPGSWDYLVTNMWTIVGSSKTNFLATYTHTSKLLDSDGDFSVTKYGLTITRSINDVSY